MIDRNTVNSVLQVDHSDPQEVQVQTLFYLVNLVCITFGGDVHLDALFHLQDPVQDLIQDPVQDLDQAIFHQIIFPLVLLHQIIFTPEVIVTLTEVNQATIQIKMEQT